MALEGQIAIVTGASRGIGQGIALQLGEAGATVYVTGRRPEQADGNRIEGLPRLEEVAQEITERGGRGIAVYVDHGDMAQVREFFARVDRETGGQLDILVNNAYSAVAAVVPGGADKGPQKFYEAEPERWDVVNNVGLRNHYFCSVYASRMMVKNKKGLIVNVSSRGGLTYLFSVPYGVGKCALDRMAADMAVELKSDGVTCVSLWPGPVRTQLIMRRLEDEDFAKSAFGQNLPDAESIEYSGRAVVALAADPEKWKLSGRILTTVDLGEKYGFADVDGRRPMSLRSAPFLARNLGEYRGLADWLPAWIQVPGWMLAAWYSAL